MSQQRKKQKIDNSEAKNQDPAEIVDSDSGSKNIANENCNEQKMDESEASNLKDPETVVYFDSQRIPTEIWNEIFQFSRVRSLFNLSLACKKFYGIIGNLPEAMDKIVLNLDSRINVEQILNSPRKYTNIKLETSKLARLSEIFEKYGPKLRALEIRICSYQGEPLTEEALADILTLCCNLRELSTSHLKINKKSQSTKRFNFKLIKLEKLVVSEYHCTFEVFNLLPDTLVEIEWDSSKIDGRFFGLLERQKNLKHLCYHPSQNEDSFNIDHSKINFKLESFKFALSKSSSNCENLYKFLKSQVQSLVSLSLKNTSYHQTYGAFDHMPKLQELELENTQSECQYESGPDFCCPALKRLKVDLSEKTDCSTFIKRFPNIQELVIIPENYSNMLKSIAVNHPNLKKLAIKYFYDGYFYNKSLKNILELVVIRIYCSEFDDDSVRGEGKSQDDISMEQSIIAMENLKVIKFRARVMLSTKSLLWILVNFKKLKHLEIDNGRELNITLLCRNLKFFKNLRFLKISNLRFNYHGHGVFSLTEPVKKFQKSLSRFPNLKCVFSSDFTHDFIMDQYGYNEEADKNGIDNDTVNFNDYSDSSDADTSDDESESRNAVADDI